MRTSAQWTRFFEAAYHDLPVEGLCEINRRRADLQDDVMAAYSGHRDRPVRSS